MLMSLLLLNPKKGDSMSAQSDFCLGNSPSRFDPDHPIIFNGKELL